MSAGTMKHESLPMQRLQSYYASCTPGRPSEFTYCDMHIMQLLKVTGVTLEQTSRELSILKVWYHL